MTFDQADRFLKDLKLKLSEFNGDMYADALESKSEIGRDATGGKRNSKNESLGYARILIDDIVYDGVHERQDNFSTHGWFMGDDAYEAGNIQAFQRSRDVYDAAGNRVGDWGWRNF